MSTILKYDIMIRVNNMAYLKYKEVTKYFNFSKVVDKFHLPKYVNDYVPDDDQVLAAYKTQRDYGFFTMRKIVLFDNKSMFGMRKQIYTIPYNSISTISIVYFGNTVEFSLFLDSGYPLRLRFVNTEAEDKMRLRLLYNCISRVANGQPLRKIDMQQLIDDDILFSK